MATIRKGAPDGFEVTIPIFLSLAFGWQIHLTMMRWKRRNGETMARRFTTWTLTSGSLVGRWTLAGRSSSAFMEPVGGENSILLEVKTSLASWHAGKLMAKHHLQEGQGGPGGSG